MVLDPRGQPGLDVQRLAQLAQPRRQDGMALQAPHQQQRFVAAIGVAPAVDVCGVGRTPRRSQRGDARHADAGAG